MNSPSTEQRIASNGDDITNSSNGINTSHLEGNKTSADSNSNNNVDRKPAGQNELNLENLPRYVRFHKDSYLLIKEVFKEKDPQIKIDSLKFVKSKKETFYYADYNTISNPVEVKFVGNDYGISGEYFEEHPLKGDLHTLLKLMAEVNPEMDYREQDNSNR
jgi:hypothetical protein